MDTEMKSFTYRLANDQITSIQKDYDQPGWTLWALLIALANVLWIMIKELEIGLPNFNTNETFILLYCLIFFYFGFPPLIKMISYGKPDLSQDRFEYPSIIIGSTRVKILFEIFVMFILLYANNKYEHFDSVTQIILKAYIILMITLQFIVLLGVFIPYPTKRNIDFNFYHRLLIVLIFSVVPLFVSFRFFLKIDFQTASFFTSLKISSLIFLTYFLLNKLTVYVTKNPILKELEKIRHDLAFNMISPEEALERIEIAVDGLRLKQLFRDDITSILNKIHLFTKIIDEIKKNLPLIKSRVNELSVNKQDDSEIIADPIINGLFHNIEFGLEESRKISEDINLFKLKISRKLSVIKIFVKNKPELKDIKNNIEEILKKGETSILDLEKELKQTKNDLLNK